MEKKHSKLILAPIMNFRDIHGISNNHLYNIEQKVIGKKIEVKIDNNRPIFINISDGTYIEHFNDTFFNMFYVEEQKRGFEPEENLIVPGRFEIELEPKEEKEISVICSLEDNIEELNARAIITNEIARLGLEINKSGLIDNKKQINQ